MRVGPDTIKVLQIGCGNFGPAHISAWHSLGLGDRLYVADPDPEARVRAKACGVPESNLTSDFRDLLDSVEVVDAVVPLSLHLSMAEAALTAGKHLLLEKPATADVDEARRLAEYCRQAGTAVQIGFHMRFHPLAVALKEFLADGELGKPVYLAAETSGYKRLRPDAGVLRNDAVHFLDLVRWLLGEPPQSVFAVLRDDLGCGMHSLALIVLTYPSGTVTRIEVGRTGVGHLPDPIVPGAVTTQVFSIVGTLGSAEVNFHAGSLLRRRARFLEEKGTWQPKMEDMTLIEDEVCDWDKVMARAFAAFLAAIEHGTPSPVPVDEAALDMAALCAAIERSAEIGATVSLETSA